MDSTRTALEKFTTYRMVVIKPFQNAGGTRWRCDSTPASKESRKALIVIDQASHRGRTWRNAQKETNLLYRGTTRQLLTVTNKECEKIEYCVATYVRPTSPVR